MALFKQNLSTQMNEINMFSVSRKTIEGVVTISAPPAYAAVKIVPRLALLKNEYPNLAIQLIGSSDFADLNSAETDIAVRPSRPKSGDFNIARFVKIIMRPYALADYINNCKQSEWNFIGYTKEMSKTPQQQLLKELAQSQKISFISNLIEIQIQAAIQGLGIAILPDFMVQNSNLQQVYDGNLSVERDVWLVVPTAIRHNPVIDIVISAIKK